MWSEWFLGWRQRPLSNLHLDPSRTNEAGLSILEARDGQGHLLTIDVQGDVLSGKPVATLAGAKFTPAESGWKLILGIPANPPSEAPEIREYSLTINNIVNTPFWAQPDGRSDTFQSYVFPQRVSQINATLKYANQNSVTTVNFQEFQAAQ